MMRSVLSLSIALLVLAGAAPFASAQFGITNAELERGLRFPWATPHNGEPYTQRYSYGTGTIVYFGANPRQLYYLDYLDRADRARKFGYPMPIDPYFPSEQSGPKEASEANPAPATAAPVRIGLGFGILRRR